MGKKYVDSKEFGKRLKAAMQAKKVTAAELAQKVGKSECTIERYIEGVRTPRAPEIVAMAKSIDVTLESLIEK